MFSIKRSVTLLLAIAAAAVAAVALQGTNAPAKVSTASGASAQQTNVQSETDANQDAAQQEDFDRYPDKYCDRSGRRWTCYYYDRDGHQNSTDYNRCDRYRYESPRGRGGDEYYYHCKPKRYRSCYYDYYYDRDDRSWHRSWYCRRS